MKKSDQAFETFEKILSIEPDNSNTINNIGTIYLDDLHQYEKSIEYFGRIWLNPKVGNMSKINALTNKSKALWLLKKYDKVVETSDIVLELEPNNVKALNDKGNALGELGFFKQSLICFNTILKIEPTFDLALMNSANALIKLNQFEEALSRLEEYVIKHPKEVKGLCNKAVCLFKLGSSKESIQLLEKAIQIDHKFSFAHHMLVNVLFHLKKYDEAPPHYKQAYGLAPNDIEILDNMGDCFGYLKKYQDAIFQCFSKIIQIDSTNLSAYEKMSMAFAKLKNYEMANLCWDIFNTAKSLK